jgi:hypothetical protein
MTNDVIASNIVGLEPELNSPCYRILSALSHDWGSARPFALYSTGVGNQDCSACCSLRCGHLTLLRSTASLLIWPGILHLDLPVSKEQLISELCASADIWGRTPTGLLARHRLSAPGICGRTSVPRSALSKPAVLGCTTAPTRPGRGCQNGRSPASPGRFSDSQPDSNPFGAI